MTVAVSRKVGDAPRAAAPAELRYSGAVKTLLRFIVSCVLALALPLQSYAASSMLMCGPLHQGAAGEAHHAPHTAPADHAAGDAHHGHAAPEAQSAATAGSDANAVFVKCSLCAACCTALGLLPHAPLFGAQPAATAYRTLQVDAPAGVLPAGLERPPRAFLA
jgi:hypothetical protein